MSPRYLSRLTRAGLENFVECSDPDAPVVSSIGKLYKKKKNAKKMTTVSNNVNDIRKKILVLHLRIDVFLSNIIIDE